MTGGNGLCQAHQADAQASRRRYECQRKADPSLAYAAQVRSSARWQKVRALHRATHPLCCDPFGEHAARGLPAYNEQSHHVVSLAEIYSGIVDLTLKGYSVTDELAYDLTNLAPLCTRCHAAIEQRERKGQPTKHLFYTGQPPTLAP